MLFRITKDELSKRGESLDKRINELSKEIYELSSEEYEKIKISLSDVRKEKYSGEQNPMYGVRRYGPDNPNYGNYWSEEQKQRASQIKQNISQETREKMSRSMKDRMKDPKNQHMLGKHHTEESKEKMRIAHIKENLSEETIAKMKESAKARFSNPENHPMFGRYQSEETKRKLSELWYNAHQGSNCKRVSQYSKDGILIKKSIFYYATKNNRIKK